MDPTTVNLLISVAVIIVIALVAWMVISKRRTERRSSASGRNTRAG